MPAVMLIVRLHRKLLARTTILGVISIAVCAATVVSLLNLGISYLIWEPLHEETFLTNVLRYALGDFTGILIPAPLALLWIRRAEEQWTPRSVAAGRSTRSHAARWPTGDSGTCLDHGARLAAVVVDPAYSRNRPDLHAGMARCGHRCRRREHDPWPEHPFGPPGVIRSGDLRYPARHGHRQHRPAVAGRAHHPLPEPAPVARGRWQSGTAACTEFTSGQRNGPAARPICASWAMAWTCR